MCWHVIASVCSSSALCLRIRLCASVFVFAFVRACMCVHDGHGVRACL
jgi:hypothetical protein